MILHTREWGSMTAPAVVCLHGIGGHGGRFRRLAEERLAGRFRVIALDLRGHGRSDYDPPWDLDTHVADLVETASALGFDDPVTWLGHSFGARLVMELSKDAPDLVGRAVLLDPPIWVPPPIALERAEEARTAQSYASFEDALAAFPVADDDGQRRLLEEELGAHLIGATDGRLRWRVCQSAVVCGYAELTKVPPLTALEHPALLVRGAESEVVPDLLLEAYREAAGSLLEVVTVPGGHTVLWDSFAETADAIETFLP